VDNGVFLSLQQYL